MPSPSRASSQSMESSSRAGNTSIDSGSQPLLEGQRKSSIGKIMDRAKSKMTGGERIADNESEFERLKAKEVEKQRRKEEYERLGLGDRTKYGKQSCLVVTCERVNC